MPKTGVKILSLLVLLVYFISTMGLVVSHIHCICSHSEKVELFNFSEKICSLCNEHHHEQAKDCCKAKTQHVPQSNHKCGKDVVVLKITADYNPVQTLISFNLLAFFTGTNTFIDPFNVKPSFSKINSSIADYVPCESGKQRICYLHQFKMDPAHFC